METAEEVARVSRDDDLYAPYADDELGYLCRPDVGDFDWDEDDDDEEER